MVWTKAMAVAALLTACAGNAVVIDRTTAGGTIVLEGPRDRARGIAEREMAAHCGDGRFVVVHEGDAVVRTEPTGEPAVDGGPVPTRDVTERRLHYECTDA